MERHRSMSGISSNVPPDATIKRVVEAIENQTIAMGRHTKSINIATYVLAVATIILAVVTVVGAVVTLVGWLCP